MQKLGVMAQVFNSGTKEGQEDHKFKVIPSYNFSLGLPWLT